MIKRKTRPGDTHKSIALLRASTEDQRLSAPAQRAAIEAWAQREGVEIVGWRIEQGVSGATPLEQRTELLAAIDDLRLQRAGRLVVAKRDRLARDVVLAGLIERLVEKAGARVYAADGADIQGPEGVLMRGIVDLFAQFERLVIGSRTRAALQAKKAKGERVGTVPFGFAVDSDGTKLVPHENEQQVVATVRALRAQGLSLRKIVAECQRVGLVSRSGRALGLAQVERIVRRAA